MASEWGRDFPGGLESCEIGDSCFSPSPAIGRNVKNPPTLTVSINNETDIRGNITRNQRFPRNEGSKSNPNEYLSGYISDLNRRCCINVTINTQLRHS